MARGGSADAPHCPVRVRQHSRVSSARQQFDGKHRGRRPGARAHRRYRHGQRGPVRLSRPGPGALCFPQPKSARHRHGDRVSDAGPGPRTGIWRRRRLPVRFSHQRSGAAGQGPSRTQGHSERPRLYGATHRASYPIAPDRIDAATKAMDQLPASQKKRLVSLRLAGDEEYSYGPGPMEHHLIPLWTVKDQYWWRQRFPAGRPLFVDHRYIPGTGGSVDSTIAFKQFRHTSDTKQAIAHYCMETASSPQWIAAEEKISKWPGNAGQARRLCADDRR